MRKLIAGNWKMNGSLAANQALLESLLAGMGAPTCEVAVCVPAVYIDQVSKLFSAVAQQNTVGAAISLGAQDISMHASGAYTGSHGLAQSQSGFGQWYHPDCVRG
jgi:triosephosphate isomerase (TIM)